MILLQSLRLQGSSLVAFPRQSWPPIPGGGLVQVRENGSVPGPQSVEQLPDSCQGVHWPSTAVKKKFHVFYQVCLKS